MSRASQHVELQLHLAVLGAQQLAEHRVVDPAEVDRVELGAHHRGVGVELAVGEVGLGLVPLEEVVAQVVGVDGGDVEQEAEALGEQREPVVDRQVGGAEPGPLAVAGHRSFASSSCSPGSAAASPSCTRRSRSSSSSPVHSSMNVFLNSSASTHPTRG